MKFLIETGSESHTSSYASLQVKFHGGEFDGQYLYQHKEFQISDEWDKSNDGHKKWVVSVYELPEGTEVEVVGKSYAGNIHRIYRLDSSADVLDKALLAAAFKGRGKLKGRLILVRNILQERKDAMKQSQEEGF